MKEVKLRRNLEGMFLLVAGRVEWNVNCGVSKFRLFDKEVKICGIDCII